MKGCAYQVAVVSSGFLMAVTILGGFIFWPLWILSVVIALTWPKQPRE
jgi:hypothetical protein